MSTPRHANKGPRGVRPDGMLEHTPTMPGAAWPPRKRMEQTSTTHISRKPVDWKCWMSGGRSGTVQLTASSSCLSGSRDQLGLGETSILHSSAPRATESCFGSDSEKRLTTAGACGGKCIKFRIARCREPVKPFRRQMARNRTLAGLQNSFASEPHHL